VARLEEGCVAKLEDGWVTKLEEGWVASRRWMGAKLEEVWEAKL
jgi:hypothetical protein